MAMIWYGHGDGINELRTHPLDPTQFASASADHSVRVWSVSAGGCTAVLGGPRGHRDQVLSVDWHPNGKQLVTAGVDGRIFIWDCPLISEKGHPCWFISEQRERQREVEGSVLGLITLPKPSLITNPIWASSPMLRLHSGPIGSVRWLDGSRLVSKSVDSDLVLWSPLLDRHKGTGHVDEAATDNNDEKDDDDDDQGIQRRHRIYQRHPCPNGQTRSIGSLEVVRGVQKAGQAPMCGLLWGNDRGDLLFSKLERGRLPKRKKIMISSPHRAGLGSDAQPWPVQSVASLRGALSTFIHLSLDQGEDAFLRCWILTI